MEFDAQRSLRSRVGCHHRKPGHRNGAGRAESHLRQRAGKSPQTETPPATCIPIKASILAIARQIWSSASIALYCAPIRSNLPKGKRSGTYWFAPIVADAEAGFGGSLNAYELMKSMIEAGAAGVHFEDQLSSAKKCGHLGGKVVVPTREFIEKLIAARLAADVCGVPTILIARTDANSAGLLLADADPRDREFIYGERTPEGFYQFRGGIDAAIARGLAYAPYADMLWCETSTPDLAEAKKFASAIHAKFPGKLLAYNCSPSFNWKKKLDDVTISNFQQELGKMGYKFQFVTLAGFHSLNMAMFHLAHGYAQSGMTAYSKLQQEEFAAQEVGYRAVTHQHFVGTGYFDEIAQVVSGGHSSTTALAGSTEAAQFNDVLPHESSNAFGSEAPA